MASSVAAAATTTQSYGADQSDTTFSTPVLLPTTHRSSSLSSSPSHSSNSSFGSSLSFHDIDSPFSPSTPLLQFPKGGVPFSWEHIPGIPKQKFSRKNSSTLGQLLPLPPPAGNFPNSSKKNSFLDEFSPRKSATNESFRKDPFFAAFVECSKDDQQQHHEHKSFGLDIWKSSSKVPSTRSLSDRFGFISMYASCKRTCTVSESIVYLPRSRNYGRN